MENLDNIIKYIEYEADIPKSTSLHSFLIITLIVGIPTAYYGVYTELTKNLIVPFIVFFGVWALYLMVDTESKKNLFVLYLGMCSTFLSIIFAVATYKIKFALLQVKTQEIVFFAVVYLLINIFTLLYVRRVIKRGINFKKSKNPMGIIAATSGLGLSLGRSLWGSSNEVAVTVLAACLLIMSLLMTIGGMLSLIRYYYICKLDRIQAYHRW